MSRTAKFGHRFHLNLLPLVYRLILLNPGCASGRESPIRIEFEDEKTSTLLQLLNQISEEINICERPRVKPQWRPPPRKTVPGRAMAANNEWSRSNTAPELQPPRKSSPPPRPVYGRTRELPLCPSKLVTSAAAAATTTIKKMAPVAPAATATTKPANVNHTTPFSVELGLAGRCGVPLGSSRAFDIHIVDLDEKSGQRTDKDNISDVSSILSMSPKGPSH